MFLSEYEVEMLLNEENGIKTENLTYGLGYIEILQDKSYMILPNDELDVSEALSKFLLRGGCDVDIEVKDGKSFIHVHHHDGTNVFQLRELTDLGFEKQSFLEIDADEEEENRLYRLNKAYNRKFDIRRLL